MEQALDAVSIPRATWIDRLRVWVLRISKPAVDAPLRIEARLSLGPKKSLVLVSCCGRRMLLSISGDAIAPVLEVVQRNRRRTS